MKFVKFIEKNVDESEANTTVLIVVDTDEAIDVIEIKKIIKELQNKLFEWDTGGIVYAACEQYFGKRNIPYKTVYSTEIEF